MDAVEDIRADNVLVQAPAFLDLERVVCGELLSQPAPDTLVGVTTTQTPDRWLTSHLERTTEPPDDVQLVCVGEQTRSAASASSDSAPISTATVADPGNLTELGTILSGRLDDIHDGYAVLCFDSLSALLRHSETRTVFQFLHVLTDLVSQNAVQAHYHLDPSAHDDQAVASVKLLVDAVVTVTAEGVEVETR